MRAVVRFLPLLVVSFLTGCDNDGRPENADPRAPDVIEVQGVVAYEDAAVTQGEITFAPVDDLGDPIKAPIRGGAYELVAPPGEYHVTVTGTAGETEVPSGMTVERAVRPDTNVMVINLPFPEAALADEEPASPEQIREDNAAQE